MELARAATAQWCLPSYIEFCIWATANRSSLSLSQYHLAELLKCHENTIWRVENGLTEPSYALVYR